MRRGYIWLAAAALGLGLACLAYAGPGRQIVRGHVGDVAAAMLVYAAFGLCFPGWTWRARSGATLCVAVAVELGQLVWSPLGRSTVGALTVGSVFDPVDLAAYVAGVVIGVGWERVSSGRPARSPASRLSR